jgi:hypothetical protein
VSDKFSKFMHLKQCDSITLPRINSGAPLEGPDECGRVCCIDPADVALTLGARGGVYIGGGIVPRFADRFFASVFRERFEAKGRFRDYLAAIPTALITDASAALSGAARAIEQQVTSELG